MSFVFRCNSCGVLVETPRVPSDWQTATHTVEGVYQGLVHQCAACLAQKKPWATAPPLDAQLAQDVQQSPTTTAKKGRARR